MSIADIDAPIVVRHRAESRVAHSEKGYMAPDGLPFFLILIAGEDGIIQPQWGLRFSTFASAKEGLTAIIALGAAYSGFVCEDRDYLYRAKW